jgi:hypothetical protein
MSGIRIFQPPGWFSPPVGFLDGWMHPKRRASLDHLAFAQDLFVATVARRWKRTLVASQYDPVSS